MKRLFAFLIAALLSSVAYADTIGVHLGSYHTSERADGYKYNNVNPGLYYRTDEGLVLGVYENSLRRTTVYGGFVGKIESFSLTVGLASGYKKECTTTKRTESSSPEVAPEPSTKNPQTATPYTIKSTYTRTSCVGFSKHSLTPIAALSYTAPAILGVTPVITVIPSFNKHASVIHLSTEWNF